MASPSVKKFINCFDIHYGFERKGGHKKPVHNRHAIEAVLKFTDDFKPDYFTLGGDQLDLRHISHWTKKSKLAMEGLKLQDDYAGFKKEILDPLNQILPAHCSKRQHIGNHECWVVDFIDENPALEGILDIDQNVGYTATGWKLYEQGAASRIGKLYVLHGDNISGGVNVAKAAVEMYERNVRFGHFHTHQSFTKTAALDVRQCKTGVAVPCLCTREASYGKGAPNRWLTGFNVGYVFPDGTFNDTVIVMVNNRFHWNGHTYSG